jgi:hypothetical protein
MSQLIHLGDQHNHQARDRLTFYSPGSSYAHTVAIYHPVHTHQLREQWQVDNYELLDRFWKKLLESYNSHRQGGADRTSTEMLARQSTLITVVREMLESGVEISVESGIDKSVGD